MSKKLSHILLLSLLILSVACNYTPYNRSNQQEIDVELIEQYIESHGLDIDGNLVSIQGLTPEEIIANGYTPLADTVESDGAMRYIILEQGEYARPSRSDRVFLHYEGRLMENEEVFDSTMDRDEPFRVNLFYAIEGMQRGIPKFNTGLRLALNDYEDFGVGYLFIPSTMGFERFGSEDPPVPENANLIYKVGVLEIFEEDN